MPIQTVEIASAFGALDGDAITDGRALDAHTLRVLAMQANRHISVGHQAFNLVWPEVTSTFEGTTQYVHELTAPIGSWELLHLPITVPKLPGLTSGTVYIRANIPSGSTVEFAAQSTVSGDRDRYTVSAAGTGSFANYSIASVPFSSAPLDEVTLYLRANKKGDLMATGTFGTPNTGAVSYANDSFYTNGYVDASAAWNTGATSNMAHAGHYVSFIDDYGGASERLIFQRDISSVANATHIEWSPPLSGSRLGEPDAFDAFVARVLAAANAGTTVQYEIRKLPTLAVTQIMGVLDGRTV